MPNERNKPESPKKNEQRTRVNQSDIPAFTLERALSIARAIGDNYAFKPASPLDIASALDLIPTTGGFRMLTGASVAYGLTSGGYSANEISLTPLGLRIVRPLTEDGDSDRAKKEAVLTPKLVGDFLKKYDGAALPKGDIVQNVLLSMGVPADRTKDAAAMIFENARSVGLIRRINEREFVDLRGTAPPKERSPEQLDQQDESGAEDVDLGTSLPVLKQSPRVSNLEDSGRGKRVFISHGKNRALIEPIKKILRYGDLEAVVSVQTQTVSLPVPNKILEEMRSCGAAIIHVESESILGGPDGTETLRLNENVLIEIGAAMALFGTRFILVVKDGVQMPSNLQGLLQLKYKGDTLDVYDTGSLLDAIADMKSRPLPTPM